MELIDVLVSGKKLSYISSDGISVSRLDRFLITEGLIDLLCVSGHWIGNRDIFDHCHIWLLRASKDWGPKPFRVFNAWFEYKDLRSYARTCWAEFSTS